MKKQIWFLKEFRKIYRYLKINLNWFRNLGVMPHSTNNQTIQEEKKLFFFPSLLIALDLTFTLKVPPKRSHFQKVIKTRTRKCRPPLWEHLVPHSFACQSRCVFVLQVPESYAGPVRGKRLHSHLLPPRADQSEQTVIGLAPRRLQGVWQEVGSKALNKRTGERPMGFF